MSILPKKSIFQRFRSILLMSYPPVGYDPVAKTLNGTLLDEMDISKRILITNNYLFHWLTLTSSFLGLPNRLLDDEQSQSAYQLFCNFVGWQANVSMTRKVINGLFSPLVTVWHIATLLPRLVVNTVKLITEVLPASLCVLFDEGIKRAEENKRQATNATVRTLGRIASHTLHGLYYSFRTLHFIGRAITSPLQGADAAYQEGKAIGTRLSGNETIGKLAGVALSILSGAITTTFYTTTLPFTFKLLTPLIINHAPHVVSLAWQAIYHPLSHVFNKPFSALGNNIVQQVPPLYKALGIATTSAALNGFTFVLSEAANAVSKVISNGVSKITNWWRKPTLDAETSQTEQVNSTPKLSKKSSATLLTLLASKSNSTFNLPKEDTDNTSKVAIPSTHVPKTKSDTRSERNNHERQSRSLH